MSSSGAHRPAGERGQVEVGTTLSAAVHAPSTVQLFRYSAATWNTHRIHYDRQYALAEGYPDVLVQSHLHGAFLARYCTEWAGPEGTLLELSLRVRRFATAGETLTIVGVVSAIAWLAGERAQIELELIETRASDGEVCVTGTARVELPLAALASASGGPA